MKLRKPTLKRPEPRVPAFLADLYYDLRDRRLLPLGATIGPAGLAVMPYTVTFDGNFFQIADFINGIDSLVATSDEEVRVDGRLVTIDGFALEADPEIGFPALQAGFALTTYLTPPGEGVTGGATPESPGGEAAPVATTTGAMP